jgi:hypothetical protein
MLWEKPLEPFGGFPPMAKCVNFSRTVPVYLGALLLAICVHTYCPIRPASSCSRMWQ